MPSETSKLYPGHLLATALSELKMTSQLSGEPEISVPDAKFGDYATNVALILGKKLKLPPVEVANKIADRLKQLDTERVFADISVAGGFINLNLSREYLLKNLSRILEQKDNFGSPWNNEDKTVIVEYFQNNVAKPPHVGHLRSAVVGDSLLRLFRFLGYRAVSDTHIGDWGTQFGILILAYKTFGKKSVVEKNPIDELNKLYVEMSAKIEADPALKESAKAEFKKLEDSDAENRKLWQWFVMESVADFERYRKLLGLLRFDHNLGESFYEDKMPSILSELQSKGLVTKGETGELYVDLEKYKLGRCLLAKSDGATTYHLRDFATYIYRKKEFNFYKNIYVVDNRQSHHFRQLFKVLELAGYPAGKDSFHVELGFMSLPEGPISTRKGNIISLQNLVDEAEKRALAIIEEKNPGLKKKKAVAGQVARAAIKYFDLSHNRKTEFVFTWDKALSFEGNTGPYLQYTHARIFGILRKSSTTPSRQGGTPLLSQEGNTAAPRSSPPKIGGVPAAGGGGGINPHEIAVLRKLNQFPEVLEQVAVDYMPNLLCNYLFELAQSFNSFYQEIPVLQEEDGQLKSFRLQLITATAQVIKNGLNLLGIEAPEEM